MMQNRLRTVLFFAFLAIFCITAMIELCALIGVLAIAHEYETKLFYAIIIEVAGSVIAFWKQMSGVQFSDPPEVSGDWGYEWTGEDGSNKHGGVCTITVDRGSLGWEFSIQGRRTWEANFKDNAWIRREFPAPYGWQSSWGTFVGADTLRFQFSMQMAGTVNQALGALHVTERKGEAVAAMEGNFFPLPPVPPAYGALKFWRPEVSQPEPELNYAQAAN